MVTIRDEEEHGERTFTVRPGFAANWRQTKAIYILIALTCLGVASVLALAGFWLVLPFAGVEVALLGWALYYTARKGTECEVVRVGPRRVEIEKGRRKPEQIWSFDLYWSEVSLLPPAYRLHPSRLLIRSQGTEVEIGRFLQEEERVFLARELKRCIGPMAASAMDMQGAGP